MARPLSASDLPPDLARFAEAQVAAGRFDSVEDVLRAGKEALEHEQERREAQAANNPPPERAKPINPPRAPFWATFTEQVHALPDAVFERLPEDGASEHDHYLYGAPKRRA